MRSLRVVCSIVALAFSSFVYAEDPLLFKKQATWNLPDRQKVIQQIDGYLESRLSVVELRIAKEILAERSSEGDQGILDIVLASTAKTDSSIAALQQLLDASFGPETPAKMESLLSSILANGSIPNWLRSDLQLVGCRYMVQQSLYDEAMNRLQPLAPESTSDPATWLFCMAVCQHHLMERDACLATLDKLLEHEMELPTRYAITARMMQADIKTLKEDSLDEIARMMNDVERRLVLGRTGKTVLDKEQAIVDKLDKMIEKLEEQQQQQQQQQQKQNDSQKNQKPNQGSQPLKESQIGETKGPGDVDSKSLGDSSGWGNLPPAQRQEALQNMTKELPSHYREVIEAYFKKLSTNQP